MKRGTGWLALVVGGAMALLGATASTAVADGPCGQDYTSNSACAISGANVTVNGTIVAGNDVDFYVFYASAETHLSLSINDTENPICSTAPTDYSVNCGQVSVELFDATNNDDGGPGWSAPQGGIVIPATWSTVIAAAGTYYLKVSGYLGSDANNNPTDVPYQLNVTSSPGVVWPYTPPAPPTPTPTPTPAPAPPPSCRVPRVGASTLAVAERKIIAGNCTVGVIRRVYSSVVRKGRVVAISPGTGHVLSNDAVVNITVSKGRRHRRR